MREEEIMHPATRQGRTDERGSRPRRRHPPGRIAVSLVITCLGVLYALYRGYYAFGGTVGMVSRPASQAEWRAINLTGAVIVLVLALLPVVMLPLWARPRLRAVLLAVCWLLAVGYIMHGVVQDAQRVLSLAGGLRIHYPGSVSVNRHAADVQDLAFNETWFLAEGFLWAALAWIGLGRSPARRWWTGTALAAIAVLTAVGLLSAFGVIGRFAGWP
jgi:hypothetical protein